MGMKREEYIRRIIEQLKRADVLALAFVYVYLGGVAE